LERWAIVTLFRLNRIGVEKVLTMRGIRNYCCQHCIAKIGAGPGHFNFTYN
jgi:hypothetical protein